VPIGPDTPVDILLPAYNEAASIEATLRELHKTLAPLARIRFVVCEDGSTDGTRKILVRMAEELPMKLVLGESRKGYSRAIIDGFRACTAPYVFCLDSDGQCDPGDFESFCPLVPGADVVMGWRVDRQDTRARLAMSGLFKLIYRFLLGVQLHDPSCSYLLVSRPALDHLLAIPTLGTLTQGFWWEFAARLDRSGFYFVEIPVNHRPRAAGHTQVYRWPRLPGIFLRHVAGLFKIRRETPRLPRHRPGG
jgi:glycosyltransferase involved in cell wall biosynthesis